MARAHFVTYLLDSEGRPIPGATVDVREPDTETLISETVYAEDDTAGSTELGNPFTAAADGKCEIWLTAPKTVDLYVTKTGYEPSTIRAIAHQLTASAQTVAEAGTPLTQRSTLNFLAGFDLTDDAVNDETEVAIDLSEVTAFTDHSAQHENGGSDEISIAGLAGIPTELQTHMDDAADAHNASAISVADAGALLVATDVEAALAEIQGNVDTDEAALADHLADVADAHDASAISVLDAAGDFTATDVEGALAELQSEKATWASLNGHINDIEDSHDASSISIVDAGDYFAATGVEAALQELGVDQHVRAHGDYDSADHPGVIAVRKAVDESVTSSIVFQDDNELEFAVAAGETWQLEMVVRYSAHESFDMKWELGGVTLTADGMSHCLAPGASGTAEDILRVCDETGSNVGGLAGSDRALHIRMLVLPTAAGTVHFRWAQNSSGATATIVRAGSYLVARRVA